MNPGTQSPLTILMMSSVPLSSPWNGADKNIARFLVQHDSSQRFLVHTSTQETWDQPTVMPVRSRWSNPMPTPDQKLRTFLYLLRYSSQADVVHIVTSYASPSRLSVELLRLWKKTRVKPLLHTVPSLGEGDVYPANFLGDMTVVFSEYSRRKLTDAGVPHVMRLYPPLDETALEPRTSPQRFKNELRLGERTILYPCHYGEHSGIVDMLRAFSDLPADIVLVFACRTTVGQHAHQEALKLMQQAHEAGVAERIRVLETVDDMPALLRACSVTALVPQHLSSKMDLPMVLLESLLVGTPIIVSDAEPMNEVLIGDGGFAVRYGDIAALRAALSALLEDDALRQTKGASGREQVRALCATRRVISCYSELYHQVIRKA